jgi:hypothetical protein
MAGPAKKEFMSKEIVVKNTYPNPALMPNNSASCIEECKSMRLQNNNVKSCDTNSRIPQIDLSHVMMEDAVPDGSCIIKKLSARHWPSFIPYNSIRNKVSNSSCNSSFDPLSHESAVEVKRKWRKDQIFQSGKSSINSSWRKVTILWSGWLEKRSSGIIGLWQARRFELRQEPISAGGASGHRVVLQYTGRGSNGCEETKRLELIDARRDSGHDVVGRACLSVGAVGRSGRVLLGSASAWETASLLSCMALLLPPVTTDLHSIKS